MGYSPWGHKESDGTEGLNSSMADVIIQSGHLSPLFWRDCRCEVSGPVRPEQPALCLA